MYNRTHTHITIHTHAHKHTYIHAHTHTRAHIHTHTHQRRTALKNCCHDYCTELKTIVKVLYEQIIININKTWVELIVTAYRYWSCEQRAWIFCTINFMITTVLMITSDSRYGYHGARMVRSSQFHDYCPTLTHTHTNNSPKKDQLYQTWSQFMNINGPPLASQHQMVLHMVH